MNITALTGALLPVFFVLVLGYIAGKRNSFSHDQAAGLSKLALSFALPASLFVGMADIPKNLLLQQGSLVLALLIVHTGFFLAAWFLFGLVKSLRGTPAIIYALALSTSATPVFGLAVLEPVLGSTAAGAVGLVALAINLVVPPAVILLEMEAAKVGQGGTSGSSNRGAIIAGLNSGLKSPLLWAPILGTALVLVGIRLPAIVAGCFSLIGSTTSGVAVFAVGLVLAAHSVRLSPAVWLGSVGRVTVQTAILFALIHLLKIESPFARETLACCSFPLATVVVLFAAKYKAVESEAASMLLVSTLALVVTIPCTLWLSR